MPLTPSSLIPQRQATEIASGPVIAVGIGMVSVRIRPDLTVAVATQGVHYVGQMVTVAAAGGNWSAAQLLGSATGSTPRIRQVLV